MSLRSFVPAVELRQLPEGYAAGDGADGEAYCPKVLFEVQMVRTMLGDYGEVLLSIVSQANFYQPIPLSQPNKPSSLLPHARTRCRTASTERLWSA